MKLALGTVQFGLDYGISNNQGKVSKNQVKDILQQAWDLGINTLDCASAYGNSEQLLGELSASQHFQVISKVPALSDKQNSIHGFFTQTLQYLQRDKIHALLFHQADNLLNHPQKALLFSQLQTLKKQGLVDNIGVSIYKPSQLKNIVQRYAIDLIQVPINVFDQRFITKDIVELCKKKKVKLHARSLFLQGLLLLEQKELSPYFIPFKNKLAAFSQLAQHLNCSKLTLALAIVVKGTRTNSLADSIDRNEVIEKLVIGVCNSRQLVEIIESYYLATALDISATELLSLADQRTELIDPSNWFIKKEERAKGVDDDKYIREQT